VTTGNMVQFAWNDCDRRAVSAPGNSVNVWAVAGCDRSSHRGLGFSESPVGLGRARQGTAKLRYAHNPLQ
jgi:hypothetical protein